MVVCEALLRYDEVDPSGDADSRQNASSVASSLWVSIVRGCKARKNNTPP